MKTLLRNGGLTADPRADWCPQFDARSRAWRAAVPAGGRPLRSMLWPAGPVLDQGAEGACVGFGWAAEAAAAPVAVRWADAPLARWLYRRAQQIDQWPGENYSGTSVLAGAKAAQERGLIGSYRWAMSLDETLHALAYAGPVVAGLRWYQGLAQPGWAGRMRRTGRLIGGHCVLLRGLDVRRKTVTVRNSWGARWGHHGDGVLGWADLETLIEEGAELCVPQDRRDPRA